jgi:nitrate/nitrite transporter NarK
VIAVYVAVLGNFVTFNFINTFFAQYLHKMFGIRTLEAGLITAGVLFGQVEILYVEQK